MKLTRIVALSVGLVLLGAPAAEAKTKPPKTHKVAKPKKPAKKAKAKAAPAEETTTTMSDPTPEAPAPARLNIVNLVRRNDGGGFGGWIGLADDEPAESISAADLMTHFMLLDSQGNPYEDGAPVSIGIAPADQSCPSGEPIEEPCSQPFSDGPLTHTVVGVVVSFAHYTPGDVMMVDGVGCR